MTVVQVRRGDWSVRCALGCDLGLSARNVPNLGLDHLEAVGEVER